METTHTDAATAQPERRETSSTVVGIQAGVLGAAVIAVFFLSVDLAAGRQPMWTPGALGSAVFLGESPPVDAEPEPVLVLAYTAAHGTFFLAAALMSAFALLQRERVGPTTALVLFGILFAVFEAMILGFLKLAAPSLLATFGIWNVTFANLLASAAMVGLFVWTVPRLGRP